jgi:hypothetical protein
MAGHVWGVRPRRAPIAYADNTPRERHLLSVGAPAGVDITRHTFPRIEVSTENSVA